MSQNEAKTQPQGKPVQKDGCLWRWFKRVLVASVVMTLIGIGAVWYAYSMATRKPAFWKERDALIAQTPREQLEQTGAETERRIVDAVTRARMATGLSTEYELDLTFDQINAWLATRVGDWASHAGVKMPGLVKGIMVTQEAGNLVIAMEVDTAQYKGVCSVVFDVKVLNPEGEEGQVMVRLVSARSGDLPVSTALVGSLSGQSGGGSLEAEQWLSLLSKGYVRPAVQKIDAQRQVRLKAFDIRPEGVKLKLQEINPAQAQDQVNRL